MIAVYPARRTPEGVGAVMARAFPTDLLAWPDTDPFVLVDDFHVPPEASFPEHPHRGFEIITYMVQGGFAHRDSTGLEVACRAGGVMRITCGRGVSHSEYPLGDELTRGLQLWVNLPRRLKGLPPEAEAREPSDVPERTFTGGRARVVAGEGGAVQLHTPIRYVDLEFAGGGTWREELGADWTGILYVLEGAVHLGDERVARQSVAVVRGEPGVEIRAALPARAAWIAGPRQREAIRMYGPFVD